MGRARINPLCGERVVSLRAASLTSGPSLHLTTCISPECPSIIASGGPPMCFLETTAFPVKVSLVHLQSETLCLLLV